MSDEFIVGLSLREFGGLLCGVLLCKGATGDINVTTLACVHIHLGIHFQHKILCQLTLNRLLAP
jgi:hypothetical protein